MIIVKEFRKNWRTIKLITCYVGYTDHYGEYGILNKDYHVNIKNVAISAECSHFVQGVRISGGSDQEAVINGFKDVIELKWCKQTTKFLFHIGDIPPCGRKFTEAMKDNYSNDCPKNFRIKNYIYKINQ